MSKKLASKYYRLLLESRRLNGLDWKVVGPPTQLFKGIAVKDRLYRHDGQGNLTYVDEIIYLTSEDSHGVTRDPMSMPHGLRKRTLNEDW